MSKSCCENFDWHTKNSYGNGEGSPAIIQSDEGWGVNGCCGGNCLMIEKIEFCPFCGAKLS